MDKKQERYKRSYPISWDQLHRDAKALSWRLHDRETPWKGIVAITRGGLVPAAIIARELGIHLIDTVCITSYDWQDQGVPTILKGIEGEGIPSQSKESGDTTTPKGV